jgi:hypothetical protein
MLACTESTDLIFKAFKIIIHLVTSSLQVEQPVQKHMHWTVEIHGPGHALSFLFFCYSPLRECRRNFSLGAEGTRRDGKELGPLLLSIL